MRLRKTSLSIKTDTDGDINISKGGIWQMAVTPAEAKELTEMLNRAIKEAARPENKKRQGKKHGKCDNMRRLPGSTG